MSIEQAVRQCYVKNTERGILYQLKDNFPAFNGHFEGHPLLPAVCQISFCADALSRITNKPMQVKAVKRAKFMNPSLPDSFIEVRLTVRPDSFYSAELANPQEDKILSRLILQFTEIPQ